MSEIRHRRAARIGRASTEEVLARAEQGENVPEAANAARRIAFWQSSQHPPENPDGPC